MPSWLKWVGGICIGLIGGVTILTISSFYLALTFKPLIINMDFGVQRSLYGVFGQFGTTPKTERATEKVDVIYYQNISFVSGYSNRTSNDPSFPGGRQWRLAGFIVNDFITASYQTLGENNSGFGVYILKRISDSEQQKDFYIGYIIAKDSSGEITKCPYVGSFSPISISEAEARFPSLKSECEIIRFTR